MRALVESAPTAMIMVDQAGGSYWSTPQRKSYSAMPATNGES
jgi:hypothetical protein